VVPDQHAAFGITRAMKGRETRERGWRDFGGLGGLVRGDGVDFERGGGSGGGANASAGEASGTRVE